jgi:glc operon protein GlcG
MLASTVLFGLLLSGATALAQLPTKPVLTLEAAKKLAAAAEEEAVKNKWNMVIAIVDDGGNLLYLQRLDGTQTGSIEVALQKAKTAVHFKRPSKALEDAVTGGRTVVLALGAMPIEGGLPLMVKIPAASCGAFRNGHQTNATARSEGFSGTGYTGE